MAFLDLAMNEIGSQGIELMCPALADTWWQQTAVGAKALNRNAREGLQMPHKRSIC